MVLYTLAVVIKSCLMLGVHRLFYLTHVSTQLYGRACAISPVFVMRYPNHV